MVPNRRTAKSPRGLVAAALISILGFAFLLILPSGQRTVYQVVLTLGDTSSKLWVLQCLESHGAEGASLIDFALEDPDPDVVIGAVKILCRNPKLLSADLSPVFIRVIREQAMASSLKDPSLEVGVLALPVETQGWSLELSPLLPNS